MIRPIYADFLNIQPGRPIRAILDRRILPPVLYEKADQLVAINEAYAESRVELQVKLTISQLAVGVRNADEFIQKHLMAGDHRPTLHDLWFKDEVGLAYHQHVVSALPAHELVPIASLLGYDFKIGRIDLPRAEEVFHALSDSTVAHSAVARRELFNQMVRCYALADEADKGMEVIRTMKAGQIRRTFVTYAPLFRLARKKQDPVLYERLNVLVRECEGGLFNKWLFIDMPRLVHILWVAVRFSWAQLSVLLVVFAGMVFSLTLMSIGVG